MDAEHRVRELELEVEFWRESSKTWEQRRVFSDGLAEDFPDGAVNASYYREQRDKWLGEIESLSAKVGSLRVENEALKAELKHMTGLYKTEVNNFAAAKVRWDTANERIAEADRSRAEALAGEQAMLEAVEKVGGSFDGVRVSLPTDGEMSERIERLSAEVEALSAEAANLRGAKEKAVEVLAEAVERLMR